METVNIGGIPTSHRVFYTRPDGLFFVYSLANIYKDAVHYPPASRNPTHSLRLRVGGPTMLLQNINPPKLHNGTTLQVKSLYKYVIKATIITGAGEGEIFFIP